MKKFMVRHGDVIIEQIGVFPENLQVTEDNVLAFGEITNHKHIIRGEQLQIFEDVNNNKFFDVGKTATLTHEEHKAITLPRGKYSVTIQREYDPVKERKVQD